MQRPKHNEFDKRVAKALGLTPMGLKTLSKMVAKRSTGHEGEGARVKLIRDGFVDQCGCVSDKGLSAVTQARKWGW